MKLYPYEREGVDWLRAHARGYLADDCGLGKTIQATTAARELGVQPYVFAPASAVPMWEDELRRQGFLPAVMSYSKCSHTRKMSMPLLICDEAHYLKTPRANRTRLALWLAHFAQRVWFLSGTPTPNHPGELYTILRAVWPDVLRRHGALREEQFYRRFTDRWDGPYGPVISGAENTEEFRDMIRPLLLRRTWDEVKAQLPPLQWDPVKLAGVSGPWPGDTEDAFKQHRHALGDAKAAAVGDIIQRELSDGAYHKIVVFAYHLSALDRLESKLGKFGLVRLDGSTTFLGRRNAVEKFQQNPNCRVFLGQLKAAGISLTLTAAHEVALVEQMWSPDDNWQAVKRIHRISQTEPCRARVFTVPASVDTTVARALQRKVKMKNQTITPLEERI